MQKLQPDRVRWNASEREREKLTARIRIAVFIESARMALIEYAAETKEWIMRKSKAIFSPDSPSGASGRHGAAWNPARGKPRTD